MITDSNSPLAARIAELDARLGELEKQVAAIGDPANQELRARLEALKIQEHALKRNFAESQALGEPDSLRLARLDALFAHIEQEETSMEDDAHFLNNTNPSSVTVAAEGAAKMLHLWQRAIHKVVGDSHPFGASAFVNHTHEEISSGKASPREPGR